MLYFFFNYINVIKYPSNEPPKTIKAQNCFLIIIIFSTIVPTIQSLSAVFVSVF